MSHLRMVRMGLPDTLSRFSDIIMPDVAGSSKGKHGAIEWEGSKLALQFITNLVIPSVIL